MNEKTVSSMLVLTIFLLGCTSTKPAPEEQGLRTGGPGERTPFNTSMMIEECNNKSVGEECEFMMGESVVKGNCTIGRDKELSCMPTDRNQFGGNRTMRRGDFTPNMTDEMMMKRR